MKVGDLVKLPNDRYFWWAGKVGLVVGVEDKQRQPLFHSLTILVAAPDPEFNPVKFGANYVELVSEGG